MICPNCSTESTKASKGGRCPNCLADVITFNGAWYLSGKDTPPMTVIKKFEEFTRVKETISSEYPVRFMLPRKGNGYKKEISFATRLLTLSDNNMALCLKTLEYMMLTKFKWKSYSSLSQTFSDFTLCISIVRSIMSKQESDQQHLKEISKKIQGMEDIFANT